MKHKTQYPTDKQLTLKESQDLEEILRKAFESDKSHIEKLIKND